MKLETLRKDNKKKWIIGSIIVIILIVTITFIGTRAKYKTTGNIPIAKGTIEYPFDLEITSIKLQKADKTYEETDTVPEYGYKFNGTLSECTVNNEKQDVDITYEGGKINIKNIGKKRNKCSIYFDQIFEGSGTEDSPYLISSIEDLVLLSNDVNRGNTYANKTLKLTRTLDFNNSESYLNSSSTEYGDYNGDGTISDLKSELTTEDGFMPIGHIANIYDDVFFEGNFDGNNKEIQNIHIENKKGKGNLGLFGNIRNSTIKNLGVSGEYHSVTRYSNMGGIVGRANNSSILDCYNKVNITSDFGNYSLGGLIGAADGNYVNVKNSYNLGNISNENNSAGLVGSANNSVLVTIDNSYNKGTITNSLGSCAGGLVGYSSNEKAQININNSHNEGEVVGNRSDNRLYLGGLVGSSLGFIQINNSYNNASVTNEKPISSHIGGLIGNFYGTKATINNSYNLGNVSGGWRTGGLVGMQYSGNIIINKSYNKGIISNDETNTIGSSLSGGIIGLSYNQSTKVFIINSYNTGNVSSTPSSTFNGSAGGLSGGVGNGASNTIINSYNKGSIKASGISVGINQNYGFYTNNVYNMGALDAKAKYSISNVSGSNYYINNSYYDNTYSGTNITNENINTTGMTLADMKTQNFVNTLNNNIKSINLESIDSILKDYTLSTWKLGTDGYPTLYN